MRTIQAATWGLICGLSAVCAAQDAPWKILEPASAPKAYAIAARECQRYYEAVTGTTLDIIAEADASNLIVIGSDSVNRFCREAVEQQILEPLTLGADSDAYRLKSAEKDGRHYLFLAGGNGRATLYAVYDFFERQAGCRYFWDGDIVPKRETITMDGLDVSESPRFAYRGIRYFAHRSLERFQAEHWGPTQWEHEIDWLLKKRLNLFMLRIGMDDVFQKAFPDIVPYPPDDAPLPEAVPRSYDDRTTAWPLRFRGELRKHVLQYARDRGLIHPEDTGTMTHWYSRTPKAFLEAVNPAFMPQSGGAYRGNPTGAVWDIREDANLDRYWKLTQAHLETYGCPKMFHTIGLAERNVFPDRAENLEIKLYAYRRIVGKLREHYPNAPLLIASWDFYYPGWTGDEVSALLGMLNPLNTFIFDYTSDLPDKSFQNWGIVGKFPWFFGIFHAYEWENDLRGNYDVIRERMPIAATDPMCKGFVYWPENSHSDSLMLEFFTKNAWRPDTLTPEELLPAFCANRYQDAADPMQTAWQAALPLIKAHRSLPPEFRNPAGFAAREVTPKRVAELESRCEEMEPVIGGMPVLCQALANVPFGEGNAFVDRDTVDLARTVAGRVFTYALHLHVIAQGQWMRGEANAETVKETGDQYMALLALLRDILALHDDFSMHASLEKLAAVHAVNPSFEQTLKGNGENSYCRTFIYELFDHYYLPQWALYQQWVEERLASGDIKRPMKPSSPLPIQQIVDHFYETPLAEMAPPATVDRSAAYRTILEQLQGAFQ